MYRPFSDTPVGATLEFVAVDAQSSDYQARPRPNRRYPKKRQPVPDRGRRSISDSSGDGQLVTFNSVVSLQNDHPAAGLTLASPPTIIAISIVKNEQDIIGPFARHKFIGSFFVSVSYFRNFGAVPRLHARSIFITTSRAVVCCRRHPKLRLSVAEAHGICRTIRQRYMIRG